MSYTKWATLALSLGLALAGCDNTTAPSQTTTLAQSTPFNPDTETDAINYPDLVARHGTTPKPAKTYRIAAIMKYFGNPYWQLLADGMAHKARRLGLSIDIRAAVSEEDPLGQAQIMRAVITTRPDVILLSPQSDTNLKAEVALAREQGILIVNVDDGVLPDAEHFVGPNQYENGVRAAQYFLQHHPQGGEVALIKGIPGVYAVAQRSQGFIDTLAKHPFNVVAQAHGDWDLQKSLDVSTLLLHQHPNLLGFYCNNDVMALGVAEAARAVRRKGLIIIGTDGISSAYAAIKAGEITGTIDSFPFETGMVAVDVAVRLLNGDKLPRVVFSPQNLVTLNNADQPLDKRLRQTYYNRD